MIMMMMMMLMMLMMVMMMMMMMMMMILMMMLGNEFFPRPVAFGLRVLLLAQEVAVPIFVEPPALVFGHFVPSFWRERVL